MGPQAYDFFKALCEKHGVEFETHEYDGLLSAD